MKTLATAPVDVDKDFTLARELTKAVEDIATGRRFLRGVASGVMEDRDGERVSQRALADMALQPTKGMKLVNGQHREDWDSEIGDIVALSHDGEHDELLIEAELYPGDPLAEKAWQAIAVRGEKLGYSIGGKLRKAFYELVDDGVGKARRRKVLDKIALRHVALTKNPSYRGTFAQAVAKTFDGPPEDDAAYTIEYDLAAEDREARAILAQHPAAGDSIWKAKPDDEQPSPGSDDAPAQPPAATADIQPSPGAGDPDAAPDDAEPSDAEAAKDLPMARHMACPNCGHEFAADLPAEGAPDPTPNDPDDEGDARKSKEPNQTMSDTDLLAQIRDLVAGDANVNKTPTTPDPAPEAAASLADVAKTLAAVHANSEDQINQLREDTQAGFEQVQKGFKAIIEHLTAQPQGRRSVARVDAPPADGLPTRAEAVTKTAVDDEEELAKSIEEAPSLKDAFKTFNQHRFGIPAK